MISGDLVHFLMASVSRCHVNIKEITESPTNECGETVGSFSSQGNATVTPFLESESGHVPPYRENDNPLFTKSIKVTRIIQDPHDIGASEPEANHVLPHSTYLSKNESLTLKIASIVEITYHLRWVRIHLSV